MARFVTAGTFHFRPKAPKKGPGSHEAVVKELAARLDTLRGRGLDLLVTCETIESYGQKIEHAESFGAPGPYLECYRSFARAEGCTVAGSVKLKENGRVYNSIAYIGPQGDFLGAYHKVNTTVYEVADGLTPGSGPVVVDTPAGKLGGVICFDLNFEGIRKGYEALRPDILTFASAYHGGLMQPFWAYACRSFFVSSLPMEGAGVLCPCGLPVALTHYYVDTAVARINLDRAMVHLDYNHEKFADIRAKYGNGVRISVPPHVGVAVLYADGEDLSAADIVKEFELELLDEYFGRSLATNEKARA